MADYAGGPHFPLLPVANEDGTLYGMLSAGDVANYDMLAVRNSLVEHVPVYNLLSVLEARILNEGGQLRDEVSGEVTIALPGWAGEPAVLLAGQHRGLRQPAGHDPPSH